MGTMFSRVMFCPECAKLHNPQHGQKFVVKGRSKNSCLTILRVSSPHTQGYTPHLVEIITSSRGIVHFRKICGMNDCGVKLYESGESWKVAFQNVQEEAMSVKDWNALVTFRGDTGYQLDD